MERITLAARALAVTGERVTDFLPRISVIFGRRITRETLERLAGLALAAEDVKLALHEGRVSPGDLLRLADHPGIDPAAAASMLARSGLSRSARREAVRDMLAVADRGEGAFEEFAAGYAPAAMPLDEALSALVHPAMERDAAALRRLAGEIRLPSSASVRFPRNLEGGFFRVEMKIRDAEELRLHLLRLEEALGSGVIGKMLEIIRGGE